MILFLFFVIKQHFWQGGDSSIKRVKVEQDIELDVSGEPEPQSVEKSTAAVEQDMDATSTDMVASTSNTTCTDKPDKSDFDELPKEMHEMKIKEDKSDDKVNFKLIAQVFVVTRYS